MAKKNELKEKCPRCGSTEFAVDTTIHKKRYCSKCQHVWAPQTVLEIKIQALEADLARVKDENRELKKQLAELKPADDKEIFE